MRGGKDLQGEVKEISKCSFNVKPNNDAAEKNAKSNPLIKKVKVEKNKETRTGRSQVRVKIIINVKYISESTLVVETADGYLYCRYEQCTSRKLVRKYI